MNSVQYIGDGKFVVTEGWLRDVLSQAVNMNIADYLGVDNWEGWCDTDEALQALYPGHDTCQDATEAMIHEWMNTKEKTN